VLPLLLSGELRVDDDTLLALLRRDASMRRAHLCASEARRRDISESTAG